MIENSNFHGGLKRAAGDEIAVTLVKANGLRRAAGKRRCVSNGLPEPDRYQTGRIFMYPAKWAQANSGGTAEMFFSLCPVFIGGQRRFFILEVIFMKRWQISE